MSKLKLGIAGGKYAGTKMKEILRKLKKSKSQKKSSAQPYSEAKKVKSNKPYSILAKDQKSGANVPVKQQSQKGSSFRSVKLRGIQGPASAQLKSSGTAESLREDLMRTHGYGPSFNELVRSLFKKRKKAIGGMLRLKRGGDNMPARNKKNFRPTEKGAGMTAAGVAAYRRANPGSKLKTAVTGKVKPGSKAAKRRKSFCARSAGQMKKFPKAAKDPNSRLRQARRRWKC